MKNQSRATSKAIYMRNDGKPKYTFMNSRAWPYIEVLIGVVLLTVLLKALHIRYQPVFDTANTALLYLLPVLYAVIRWGRTAAISSAMFSVIAFDYFFVPPVLSFSVADLRDLVTFAVFLLVAFITGDLASRLKSQAETAQKREQRTAALYALSRKMAAETDIKHLLETIVQVIGETIDGHAMVMMPNATGQLVLQVGTQAEHYMEFENEELSNYWEESIGKPAERSIETVTIGLGLYVPLKTKEKVLGILGVIPREPERTISSGQQRLLEAFANLSAVAILRLQLAVEAQQVSYIAASEKLRTALFNSVSHDLRTPLASITGAVTSLQDEIYDPEARQALIETIKEGALRMNNMVGNLLDSARLESGMLSLNKDWCDIQDIIGVALSRTADTLQNRILTTDIPAELPLVNVDFSLIEQVIVNLIYNAVNYSPDGSEITVSVSQNMHELRVTIRDYGNGIPDIDKDKVFDKFYRLYSTKHVQGTGLGLSICKGLIEVHEGLIWVESSPGSGSTFIFTLPLGEQPLIIDTLDREDVNNFR